VTRRAAILLLLVAVTVAIYARVATFEFINFDDSGYVRDNAQVLNGLTWDGAVWAFTTTSQANWHPLTWLSLQLDTQLYGSSPRGYHATNIVLHIACVVLLFLLFARMTGSEWRSALVAALFAVHPLHVESVAWIAERKDVLSTALGLLACHFWLDALARPRFGRRALAVSTYGASLLAKPMLVSLPILLLLFDVWPLARRATWRRLAVEKTPFVVLAALSCVATYLAQSQGGVMRTLTQYPFDARAANAAMSYVLYLWKAIWPSGLALFYPYRYGGFPAVAVAAAVAVLAAVTALCFSARLRAPYLLVGWLWYLVTLVPVIGLVQVGSQAMADRYTYVPLIGPFVMLAFALPERPRRALMAAVVAWLVALSAIAYRQAGFWRDSVALFSRSIAVTKDNAVAEHNLSRALFDRGQIESAVAHCAEAVRIAPDLSDAQANLVRGLLALGRNDEAVARTQEALRLRPNDSKTHVNAGLIARMAGRGDAAEASFREAIRLDPKDQEAHLNLGAILAQRGRRDEAIAEFETAVRLRPGDARARQALSRLLAQP
jgi:Flp pilus assembly protein TadD